MSSGVEESGSESEGARDMGAVAWIILSTDGGPTADPDSGHLEPLGTAALDQVMQAVRSDDRVCPVSTTTLAIAFGTVVNLVPLDVLGDRLARAIGPGLSGNRADPGLAEAAGRSIAVGLAAPTAGESSYRFAQRARTAAGSSVRALGRGGSARLQVTEAVTVDRPTALAEANTAASAGVAAAAQGASAFVQIRRRVLHRYERRWADDASLLVADHRAIDGAGGTGPGSNCNLCVLVIDPMAARDAAPGFSSLAALSMAEQLGCRSAVATVGADEPLVTSVDGVDVDVVVLVLDGAWVGRSPNWESGAWGRPSQLTTAYVDKGVLVLAVSAGAGAGALASCVSQDALALFDLDRLPDALRSLNGSSVAEALQNGQLGLPGRFRALLGLTAGERRVLFYLTEGWAAQDIADELVVSLTTVRSHIRSVLRKLEVRSQLAAVAIANSRDLEHHTVTANA